MSTFKTSLKIVAAHRKYVLIYLMALSLLGLNAGAAQTEDTSSQVKEATASVAVIDRDGSTISQGIKDYVESVGKAQSLEDSSRPFRTPPRRTASATSSSFRPDTGSGSRRPLAKAPSLPGWTRSSDTNRPQDR